MRSPGIESLNDTTQGRKVSLIVRVIRWIPPIICERAELRALRGSRRKNRFQLCSRFSSYLMVLLRTSWPVCIQYSSFDYYHYHYHYSSACRMPSKVGTIWPRAVPGKRSLRSIDRSIAICELIEERERERGERERGVGTCGYSVTFGIAASSDQRRRISMVRKPGGSAARSYAR